MAKNSDKNAVLERRLVELMHAIACRQDHGKLAKRTDALKQAVFAVAKKHHARTRPFTKREDNPEWQMVVHFWDALTMAGVVEIVSNWGDRPGYKEVLSVCKNVDNG